MLSRKYAEISIGLILIFALFSGCSESKTDPSTFHWIGLNEQTEFEIRAFPKNAQLDEARLKQLNQHIRVLTERGQKRCGNTRVTVIGDTRAAYDDLGVSIYFSEMLAQMQTLNPDLVLHVGDLVKNGSRPQEWRRYLPTLPALTPLIAVRGNHDRGGYFYEWGFGVSEVFKLDFGPIRLFGLDSEGGTMAVASRLDALERIMAEPTNLWKVVLLHRPIWSQGLHGSDEIDLNHRLINLFDDYGVVLVLSGHDHNYERFCPTRGTGLDRQCLGSNEGTHYVVTGGGATMPNPIPTFWRGWTDPAALKLSETSIMFTGDLHFIELDVTQSRFVYRAHKSHLDGFRNGLSVMDAFEVHREPRPCP